MHFWRECRPLTARQQLPLRPTLREEVTPGGLALRRSRARRGSRNACGLLITRTLAGYGIERHEGGESHGATRARGRPGRFAPSHLRLTRPRAAHSPESSWIELSIRRMPSGCCLACGGTTPCSLAPGPNARLRMSAGSPTSVEGTFSYRRMSLRPTPMSRAKRREFHS